MFIRRWNKIGVDGGGRTASILGDGSGGGKLDYTISGGDMGGGYRGEMIGGGGCQV